MSHPGHFHFFKNIISKLSSLEHEVKITLIKKENLIDLLSSTNLEYNILGKHSKHIFGKIYNLFSLEIKTLKLFSEFNPELVMGIASSHLSHIAKLYDVPCWIFDDTEHSRAEILLYKHFATKIFSPNSFTFNLSSL